MSTDKEKSDTTASSGNSEGPDEGPSMSEAGAAPSGSQMAHWDTSNPNPDATTEGPVTGTVSKPLPGEKGHAERAKGAKLNVD